MRAYSEYPHLDKPEFCFTSGCSLALCRCGHSLFDHNPEGSKACEAQIVTRTKEGKGKKAVVTESSVPCSCKRFQSVSTGFVLGSGDPRKANFAICAEAPGSDEVAYRLGGDRQRAEFDDREILRRQRDYPELSLPESNGGDGEIRRSETRWIKIGSPLVGRSGRLTDSWLLRDIGRKIAQDDVFADNVLRCLPPKGKDGSHYPIGDVRKKAEQCCRHWDRWHLMAPELVTVGIHPASLMREITPLPLMKQACLQRASDFVRQGFKTIVTFGGKATQMMLGYGANVTRYVGEYLWVDKREWRKE